MRIQGSAGVKLMVDQRVPAAERLLGAVSSMWRTHGRAEMSARQVSHLADAQASQINYYFGSFEQLLCSSQARAIAAAHAWSLRTLDGLGRVESVSDCGSAIGHVLAAVIDEWCREQADLAFAWAECQGLAARNPDYADANREWQALWHGFWMEACARLGVPDLADLMRVFFNGEAFLHRIAWRAPFDRACLSETCVSWARLLVAGEVGEGPLRDYARGATSLFAAPIMVSGSVQERVAEAAANIVGQEGPAAVTHRAVAQGAGLNLGAVTYHFPSGGALMAAAWAHVYLRLTRPHQSTETGPLTRDGYIHDMTAYSGEKAQQPDVLAMEALLSQAARDAALRDMGAMIRYNRGQSTYLRLRRLPREKGPLTAQAAGLVSSFLQGMGRDLAILDPVARSAEAGRLTLKLLTAVGVQG